MIILNSVTLKRKGIEYLKGTNHEQINTSFDNDAAGTKTLEQFKDALPIATIIP